MLGAIRMFVVAIGLAVPLWVLIFVTFYFLWR